MFLSCYDRLGACYLFFEYLVSGAAVAKGFTQYFASLTRIPLSSLRYKHAPFEIDWMSALFSLAVAASTLRGAAKSSTINIVMTAVQIAVMVFIIIAGVWRQMCWTHEHRHTFK